MGRFSSFQGLFRAFLFCAAFHLLLQSAWAHRIPAPTPAEPLLLRPLLEQPRLTDGDFDTLFLQTGLSPAAVKQLLRLGEAGVEQILQTQAAFSAPRQITCQSLIPGRITCEDLLAPSALRVPLAPLEPGDLLVTFSTHTAGWRHGHAGLVIDGETALEAAKLGEESARQPLSHWTGYAGFLVLRVRNAPAQARAKAVQYALDHLDGAPYSLLCGLGWAKAPAQPRYVQCAYLPWLAWQQCGCDLDSDGGRIVTVADLANSPLLEVVQVYGLDCGPLAARTAAG